MTKVSYICAVLLFIGALSMPSEYYSALIKELINSVVMADKTANTLK